METKPKGLKKTGGRKKGSVNKTTKALKDMIFGALYAVGGQKYFEQQAIDNPIAYMTLIGKYIPSEIAKEEKTAADTKSETSKTILFKVIE